MIENHTHNLFLQVALDTGLLGFAAFVVLLFLAVRSTWHAVNTGGERHLAIGILAAFTVLMVHGLGDVVVWGSAKSGIFLWVLLGFAAGLDQIISSQMITLPKRQICETRLDQV